MRKPNAGQALAITGSARTQPGTVLAVTSRSQVIVQVDAPDAANDRSRDACSPGRAGSNAGGSIKVEACAQSNGAIELFLPMGYAIEPGDAFAIHPGCDKRLDTCIARFANVLNFRGEPYVPGQDALMSYPDAR